jgi:cell wall-associated NlpC family hydrolase
MNLYLDNAEAWGFYRVFDLKVGDVILIQVHANVPNHAAIYIGNEKIMHHVAGRLSKTDPYGGYWLKHSHSIYRHKDGPS